MSERLKAIDFPGNDIGEPPRALRLLADQIEASEYGDAHGVIVHDDVPHPELMKFDEEETPQ